MVACATGPKGEGGLDDATGAGGTGASSMKQTSGAVNLGMCMSGRDIMLKYLPGITCRHGRVICHGCCYAGNFKRGEHGDSFGMGSRKLGFQWPWQKKKKEEGKK